METLAFERVSKVFGLAASAVQWSVKRILTPSARHRAIWGMTCGASVTFKVEARRADKSFPMTSPELMRELGAYLLDTQLPAGGCAQPSVQGHRRMRDFGAYIHGPKVPRRGSCRYTRGRALNLLSGGIDSPVAAYRMAKRGLALDHIPTFPRRRTPLSVPPRGQRLWPSWSACTPAAPICLWCPTQSPRSISGTMLPDVYSAC